MYCDSCGHRSTDDVRFCSNCGAPLDDRVDARAQPKKREPVAPPAGSRLHDTETPRETGGTGSTYSPGGGPGGDHGTRRRRSLWAALTAITIVVIIIAVTVPLVLAGRSNDEGEARTTTAVTAGTTSTRPRTTTTSTPGTSASATSNSLSIPGLPGDSAGAWVERKLSFLNSQPLYAALSEDALLVLSEGSNGYKLLAHAFASAETFELPVGDGDVGGIDIDGMTAVWWEGAYDQANAIYNDQHIYSYKLPDGPKIDVTTAEGSLGYAQIAGPWITWVEGRPWEDNPDEYWRMPIMGTLIDADGKPVDEPTSLVPSAVAAILGDSVWTYSLTDKFLAWEQGVETEEAGPGTYVLDLGTLETRALGVRTWRPSLAAETLVYWEDGLATLDLMTGEHRPIDARGDFAAAAPTFAAYYRATDDPGSGYEIVARGYEGVHEQVLAKDADPPWMAAPVCAATTRIAFLASGSLHVFEWKSR
jgi:hypothetical protein